MLRRYFFYRGEKSHKTPGGGVGLHHMRITENVCMTYLLKLSLLPARS